jgi:SAM-dependent methyltransferase
MNEPADRASPPALFDRRRVARRLAARAAGAADFVTRLVLDDLAERLAAVQRRFERAAIIGPNAALLPAGGETAKGAFDFRRVGTLIEASGVLAAGPERPALDFGNCDLIVSVLDMQIVDDLPLYLLELRRHLRPDGLFLGAALGGNSLTELRRAWLAAEARVTGGAVPRVIPMLDVRDAGMLLQRAGFALPVTDVETHLVRYDTPFDLMQELRALGAANPLRDRPRRPVTRGLLQAAAAHYADIATEPDGRVRATLEIVWMAGWAPDRPTARRSPPEGEMARLADTGKDRSPD